MGSVGPLSRSAVAEGREDLYCKFAPCAIAVSPTVNGITGAPDLLRFGPKVEWISLPTATVRSNRKLPVERQ